DQRPERQAGAVRRPQPAHRAPAGAAPVRDAAGGLPGVPALPAPALPRSSALAVAGPGAVPRGGQEPAVGGPVGDRAAVAAQAVLGTERDGPAVEGIEAIDRSQPPVSNGGPGSGLCGALVPRVEPPASPSESRRLVRGLLAQGFLGKLLATYLAVGGYGNRKRSMTRKRRQHTVP